MALRPPRRPVGRRGRERRRSGPAAPLSGAVLHGLTLDRKPFGFLSWPGGGRVPSALRPDPSVAARRPPRGGRPDPGRPHGRTRHDPHRGGQAPAPPRGGRPRRHPPAGPGEAALPQPGPDPPHPRPVGEQVHRAVGRRTGRPQDRAGAHHGEDLRDLHPHDAGAAVGGDHRPGHPRQVPLRRQRAVGLDSGLELHARASGRRRSARRGENLVVDPPHRLVQTMSPSGARRPGAPARRG